MAQWDPVTADAQEQALHDLVSGLESARDAAAGIAGRPPLGLRAVEAVAGRRSYLCAFEGPAFLCLTSDLRPEGDVRRVRETASASLLWEHVEGAVDADALRDLASAIGRLLALGGDPPEMTATLELVAARALHLATWRDQSLRALASLPAVDDASALQDRLAGAYARFLRASEPLVAVQDELPEALVAALRDVEESAARAGAGERLADRLSVAMPECDDGAGQIAGAHLTRLS